MNYSRINEDYLDREDILLDVQSNDDFIYEDVCADVQRVIEGRRPVIDLCSLPDAYWKPDSSKQLREFIARVPDVLGEECNLNWIDVSRLTSLSDMFSHNRFNGDISRWDVSNIHRMFYMFFQSSFNGNIKDWDVSSVTDMRSMFAFSSFNSDISEWKVRVDCLLLGMFQWCKIKCEYAPKRITENPTVAGKAMLEYRREFVNEDFPDADQ